MARGGKNLSRRSFILFGSSFFASSQLARIANASNLDVIVIGAGAAGLAATAALIKKGKSVLCIEANNRIGGRVHTDHTIFGVPYDMGAHWITLGHRNPYSKYGQNEGFTVYEDPDEEVVYDGNVKINNPNTLWKLYNRTQNVIWSEGKGSKGKDISPLEIAPEKSSPWYDTVHLMIGPYSMAKDYNHFSCKDWAHYGETSIDWFCKEGFGSVVAHRWRDVPVQLNTQAKEINWDGQEVRVKTNNGTLSAKKCIVTVSTGVLAAEKIKFSPSLPVEKYEAFNGITMGIYNHVALQFKKNFFDLGNDGYLYYKVKSQNDSSPKATAGIVNVGGSNLSLFDTGGEFARELEKEGEQASINFALEELRVIFGSKIDKHLVKAHATMWGRNPLTIGSYASAEPGKFHLRKILREPVGEKIFFSGEATTPRQWATVNGAHISGNYVANLLLKSYL